MNDPQFPIHCKHSSTDGSNHWFYKIISENEVLTVRMDLAQKHMAIDHKKYDGDVTHEAYDSYIKKELEEVTAKDFFVMFTNTSNLLINASR